MTPPSDPAAQHTSQAHFERRWGALRNARVRALAWLLDAPGLLDGTDPSWQGKVLRLGDVTPDVERWLFALDHDPAALDAALGERAYTRLGLYAEKLMAFYFRAQGSLVAHGLQVRATRNDTVGEFDFLLDAGPDGVEHIELATKFYLLHRHDPANLDTLVGPNLADSLGAKMRKIVERQLILGEHPAAQALLARPVVRARALVKGWLFYPLEGRAGAGTDIDDVATARPAIRGIDPGHCRGFWCPIGELDQLPGASFAILPKLQWLAPYRTDDPDRILTRAALQVALSAQFNISDSPILVALLQPEADHTIESARGFIVPPTWRSRAAALP
jgi:hypothetical protein